MEGTVEVWETPRFRINTAFNPDTWFGGCFNIIGPGQFVTQPNQFSGGSPDPDGAIVDIFGLNHETGGLDILHGDDDHTLGIRWSTSSHSAEPVPIYAFGAGAERFTGVKDNTDIARTLSDILDLGMFE